MKALQGKHQALAGRQEVPWLDIVTGQCMSQASLCEAKHTMLSQGPPYPI